MLGTGVIPSGNYAIYDSSSYQSLFTGPITATAFTGSGLLMTDRAAASASAGATYTTTEQDLLNQIKSTLIKYGMMT